ncbi:MAG: FAD-dependent oxidoreductase [Deltaproteobacteria bacterium]|nr:FAD-dependent oxidoreductase [Deltaproteobacteria bacterium]
MTLKQEPRYVDAAKCTGCGDCARACPVSTPDTFNLGLNDCKAIYRAYPQAIPATFAIKKYDRAPCIRTCPANVNAQGYIQLIKAGKYQEALSLIMERLPLPGTLGRICPHPCEVNCRRQDLDEPVSICALKRFVADQVDWDTLPVPEIDKRDEEVAIIGSGPGGLSCAYQLALMGYRPVIFEAAAEPGGWMRYGVPEYRLPRAVLQREIDYIRRLGVDIRCNSPITPERTVGDLVVRDGYPAVFISVGCQESVHIRVPGIETAGVVWAADYLKEVATTGIAPTAGKQVVVIGGGNVGIDAARIALRKGASRVTIVCLEGPDEMPASPLEIEETEKEGIEIRHRWGVKQILPNGGRVNGVWLKKVAQIFDEQGHFAPKYYEDQLETLEADIVIMSIGQRSSNLRFLTVADGIELTPRGLIKADPDTLATTRKGVFAGGDVVTGPYIAIAAIADGREAAISIDRYLRGVNLKEGRQFPLRLPAGGKWQAIPKNQPKQWRSPISTLPLEEWVQGFQEICQGLTPEAAREEAGRCLNCGVCSECLECGAACLPGAVNHRQTPETTELEVGSVILATGFKPFDPRGLSTYLYGVHPNVVTTLEFERFLSPGGPLQGHIQRPSDGRDPQKIAWILCVGSRSEREGAQAYCSSVCCMTSLKQALIAREHVGPNLDMAIFYMDMRTPRKDFEKYYQRARGQGTRMIRSRIHSLKPLGDSGDLELSYVTEDGQVVGETFDLVVLATGMVISPATRELAENLGVQLSRYNFVEHSCFDPVATSRPGIYACGVLTGPKDIPQSVREGSAAAAAATRHLASARGSLLKQKVYPPERDVAEEEPRIGVFICNCGINIGGIADVPAVAEYTRGIANVAYVQENLFSCSEDAQTQMIGMIREHRLNRVVVAACSPTTHQPIFQDMLRNAGLNKYLFEMANIRNQCTWVHQYNRDAATKKCRDLVNMGVAKARLLRPLEYPTVAVTSQALVLGGGVSGMTTALALADQGYEVDLAEASDRLGGHALKLHTTWRGEQVKPYLDELIDRVQRHDHIHVHFEATVSQAAGSVGNFTSRLSNGALIRHGVVVLATGAEPYRPDGQYLYRKNPHVFLSLDMDREIATNSLLIRNAQAAAFIQCVGSRIPERPYCSRVCCTSSVDNALKFKEINPEMDVYILYRDLRTHGEREYLYHQALQKGVIFIRYQVEDPPRVEEAEDGRIRLRVQDHILGRPVELTVDLLTLASAIVPRDNRLLAEMYKVALNEEGFFSEAHAKIRPVDCATDGIFLAGLCHNPKPLEDSIRLGLAAAVRAATILSKDRLELDAHKANPVDENCDGCAFCVDGCPFKALTLLEYMKEGQVKKTVEVNETLCKGCGSCMATCPKQGIYVSGFMPEQLGAQVEAALGLI